jgi:transposase-like protein
MASAVKLRTDFSAKELRRLAAGTKNVNQSRRLLLLAAVLDGMNRTEAARIGGMDRQTLRDWVHRFNEHGPVATAARIDPDEVAVTPDAKGTSRNRTRGSGGHPRRSRSGWASTEMTA